MVEDGAELSSGLLQIKTSPVDEPRPIEASQIGIEVMGLDHLDDLVKSSQVFSSGCMSTGGSEEASGQNQRNDGKTAQKVPSPKKVRSRPYRLMIKTAAAKAYFVVPMNPPKANGYFKRV